MTGHEGSSPVDLSEESDPDDPDIGVFNTNTPIQLRRLSNGGWVVSQAAPERGMMGLELGAYSSAKEMLDTLAKHLQ